MIIKRIILGIEKCLCKVEDTVSILLLMALVVVCMAQVVMRLFFNTSLPWAEEMSRYIFIFMVYLAGSICTREHDHIRVELVTDRLPPSVRKWVLLFADCIFLYIMVMVTYHSYILAANAIRDKVTSAAMQIHLGYMYLIIPICFGLMSFHLLLDMVRQISEKEEKIQ